MIEIIHNNRCSKSITNSKYFERLKIEFSIIEYLKSPLTDKTLNFILIITKRH